MAANRQTDRHTHAHAQCSHASVRLTQARPNYNYCLQKCLITWRNFMVAEKSLSWSRTAQCSNFFYQHAATLAVEYIV